MTIDTQGLPAKSALRERVTRQLTGALGALDVTPVTAKVTFFDDNGPKGGVAIRCALTVRLPHRPVLRVEHVADTPRRAFDASFAALERQLAKYRELGTERTRRPKKYYAAKRLLTGDLSAGDRTPAKGAGGGERR